MGDYVLNYNLYTFENEQTEELENDIFARLTDDTTKVDVNLSNQSDQGVNEDESQFHTFVHNTILAINNEDRFITSLNVDYKKNYQFLVI